MSPASSEASIACRAISAAIGGSIFDPGDPREGMQESTFRGWVTDVAGDVDPTLEALARRDDLTAVPQARTEVVQRDRDLIWLVELLEQRQRLLEHVPPAIELARDRLQPPAASQDLRAHDRGRPAGHRNRLLEPATTLPDVTVVPPVRRQGDDETEEQVAVSAVRCPDQRGSQVIEILDQAVEPGTVVRTPELRGSSLGDADCVCRVPRQRIFEIGFTELLLRELADRLEHPESRLAGGARSDGQQVVVDEQAEIVEQALGGSTVRRHRASTVDVEAADEHASSGRTRRARASGSSP